MAVFPRLFPFRRPERQRDDGPLASDALPLPIWFTNTTAFFCFTLSCYYLLPRWGEKNNNNVPLHFLNLREILAIVSLLGSFIYMIGFFGIPLASWDSDDEQEMREDMNGYEARPGLQLDSKPLTAYSDEDLALAVKNGEVPSHSLESALGDSHRAVYVRRKAVELAAGSLQGLPVEGLDYLSVLGQCCEMVVGYVQIPVGVAGPLMLDGFSYMIPMATTEGCLVASTNRGCKAISQSAGATSVLLKDGMTRAPVVKFPDVKGAAKLKYFIKDRRNFQIISSVFKGDSRFAKLQKVSCTLAGRNVYMRFRCSTGDAMGMNMISKGVQNVLSHLKDLFPDMDIISISGNYCADKKATAVNWIEGRGKSVVCEAIVKEEIVEKVLKTSVASLLELNTTKNLVGSALAGAVGGFNAHAANIVSAIFIATGQDPAQNVESSQCITLMELAKNGRDLHASVTMPCIEVGTIGGGTQLASQAACLNLLGVKGPNLSSPGSNAQMLARIVAGGVLAGELSLMAALAAGQLVKSHMKYNRSKQDLNKHHVSD